jgi:hypothetical protein
MGGRVDNFAVVESDPRIIYLGLAAGEVFETVNGFLPPISSVSI